MTNPNIPPGQPFGGEEQPSAQSQKVGLKKVSSQKSIFDSLPKKPTQADLEQKVQQVQEKQSSHQLRAKELTVQFGQLMADKTLPQNKNGLQKEVELDLLRNMVSFAQNVNSDPSAPEGEGSLSWIIVLLKNCFSQRDKINNLEYDLLQLKKKVSDALDLDKTAKSV